MVLQAVQVLPVDRIAAGVGIEVYRCCKAQRFLARPSPNARVIVACAEAGEPRSSVVEPSGKSERLQVGVATRREDSSPRVVVEALYNRAVADAYQSPDRAKMIGKNPV